MRFRKGGGEKELRKTGSKEKSHHLWGRGATIERGKLEEKR